MSNNGNIGFLFYRDYFGNLDLSSEDNNVDTLASFINNNLINRKWSKSDIAVLLRSDEKSYEVNQNGFKLITNYPGLLVGAGTEHEINTEGELKLGLYFDFSSGMPVIPGSSVKGVIRSVFPQWGKHKNTTDEIKWTKTYFIKSLLTGIDMNELKKSDRDSEFKDEIVEIEEEIFEGKIDGKPLSFYNRDVFSDAIITRPSSYKTTKEQILGTDSITPHVHEGLSYAESMMKNPVPLSFLKVLPGVEFLFQFDLKERENQKLTIKQRIDLFKAIILSTGLGAKTNVGYGQFKTN